MVKVIARQAAAAAIFGVLTIGSFVSAQAAQPARELPSVTVRYADLDLNTAGGVDALYGRLRAAARAVCDVRAGRPLVEANAALARRELHWEAELGLDDMCADSWRWQSSNPAGYP